MDNSKKWELFETMRNENEEKHVCKIGRIQSLRYFCTACELVEFFEELDQRIKDESK